ncbi:MAG TPA: amidohydrolase family protein, partial [Caulobacter sp.]|nr:amidohydrolase family protein [Caulobacter sp.]
MRIIAPLPVLALTLVLWVSGCQVSSAPAPHGALLLRNATVIDGTGAPGRPGTSLLIENGRIARIIPPGQPLPRAAREIDATGRYVIPGLIDTHVHLCADNGPRALEQLADLDTDQVEGIVTRSLRQHLAAGVTTVRDLGDAHWAVVDRRPEPGAGPTVVAAGPPITSVRGHCWWLGGEVAGVEELRRAVRERADHGADVVKIMASGGVMSPGTDVLAGQFTLEELRAVVEEAHALGLPVTAHAHPLTAVEACFS